MLTIDVSMPSIRLDTALHRNTIYIKTAFSFYFIKSTWFGKATLNCLDCKTRSLSIDMGLPSDPKGAL